jgi:hypothetical protein
MHLDKGPQPVKFSCTILDRFGTWLVARTEEFREVVHLGGLDRMDSVQVLQLREGGGRWAALQHGNAHNKSAIPFTYKLHSASSISDLHSVLKCDAYVYSVGLHLMVYMK